MGRSKPDDRTDRFFRHPSGQDGLFDKSHEEQSEARRGRARPRGTRLAQPPSDRPAAREGAALLTEQTEWTTFDRRSGNACEPS